MRSGEGTDWCRLTLQDRTCARLQARASPSMTRPGKTLLLVPASPRAERAVTMIPAARRRGVGSCSTYVPPHQAALADRIKASTSRQSRPRLCNDQLQAGRRAKLAEGDGTDVAQVARR